MLIIARTCDCENDLITIDFGFTGWYAKCYTCNSITSKFYDNPNEAIDAWNRNIEIQRVPLIPKDND